MNVLKLLMLVFVGLFISQVGYGQGKEEELKESDEPAENKYIDDIVQRRLVVENKVLAYEPIREADIAWEKRIWSLIDVRQKINLPFMHPSKPFFNILREMADNGDITVFEDEEFTKPLSADDLKGKINSIDTFTDFDYDTYEETIKIVESEINYEDIKRYRLKEIYFFDEESSTLKVRIMGIAPIKDYFDDDTQEYKYSAPLFWIYYPEAREYLAKHRVFNDFNDMSPMTWYDLFEARFFGSFIYKKSNVLELRLQDQYYGYDNAGRDRLLESAKIKEELFNFEHDLWTY